MNGKPRLEEVYQYSNILSPERGTSPPELRKAKLKIQLDAIIILNQNNCLHEDDVDYVNNKYFGKLYMSDYNKLAKEANRLGLNLDHKSREDLLREIIDKKYKSNPFKMPTSRDIQRFMLLSMGKRSYSGSSDFNISDLEYLKQPIKGEVVSVVGGRPYQEDRYCIVRYNDIILYGVFDGHGGHRVAESLTRLLPIYIFKELHEVNLSNQNRVNSAINKAFLKLDKYFFDNEYTEGSTAVVAMVINSKIYIINLGDSRCLLVKNGKVLQATQDHKPNSFAELIRVKSTGSFVSNVGTPRLGGMLTVSRSVGDMELKTRDGQKVYLGENAPVSPLPSVSKYNVTTNGGQVYLVMATDGLWDVLSNQEIASLLATNQGNVNEFFKAALGVAEARGSTDNITILVEKI